MNPSLNERLLAIGFRLAGTKGEFNPPERLLPEYDIERTLLDAAQHVAREKDYRLASLLFTWVKVHGEHVVVEKLRKHALPLDLRDHDSYAWVQAFGAFAHHEGMTKWKLLVSRWKNPKHLYPKEISEPSIARKGAVPWLEQWNLLLPENSIRIREKDVLTVEELIEFNLQYRNRFIFGPNWRADVATAVDEGAKNPSDVMYRAGCSYEPAYRISNELMAAGYHREPSVAR